MRQVRNQEKAGVKPFDQDPTRHYCMVERPSPKSEYLSPLDEMLADGYQIESEDRTITGHSRQILISCPVEQYNERQKASEDEARAMVKRPSTGLQRGEIETVQVGAMTAKQLMGSGVHDRQTA